MIYTDMEHLARYLGISAALDTAIKHLMGYRPEELTPGRNEVDGDQVFINRFHYTTMPLEEAAFEAHEAYADIHLVLEGREYIGVTPLSRLNVTGEDKESDNIECSGPVETLVPMEPGKVLIVFPEDVHLVKIADGGTAHVEKEVVKAKM